MASLSQPSWSADGGGISLSICPNLELMKWEFAMLEKASLHDYVLPQPVLGARLQNVTTTN